MENVTSLLKIDFPALFFSVFLIIVGLKSIVSAFEWLFQKCGIEFKWMQKNQKDHELLIRTADRVAALQEKQDQDTKQSVLQDKRIQEKLARLTALFIDKEIDDMRWEIINFAAKISEGRPCSKESYRHCLNIYEKYEKIIEENGLKNGEAELSMEIIQQSYKDKLINGFQ